MTTEQEFSLNPGQQRNLRNWASAGLLSRAFPLIISLPTPLPLESVRSAVRRLVSRHGALRSQIVRHPDGMVTQRVNEFGEALASLNWNIVKDTGDLPAPAASWFLEEVGPEAGAFRCSLLVNCEQEVTSVRFSVSHMFTDAIGADILVRDFIRFLNGHPVTPEIPLQPADYSCDLLAEQISENTEYWKRLLCQAPRSCTYAGARRDARELMHSADVKLSPAQASAIATAASRLRVTEHSLWSAAASALVQAVTTQGAQVFRETYANRFTADDANVVAQLAQAVFLPIGGSGTDTLAERAVSVFGVIMNTYQRGVYDANKLLAWLNRPPTRRGAIFQPAFEVNYLSPATGPAPGGRTGAPGRSGFAPRISTEMVTIDPFSAKADLGIEVVSGAHGDICPRVRLWARRPVYSQRRALDLLRDLLKVMQRICAAPDSTVDDLTVRPFDSVALLRAGHHSGVAFDPAVTRDLLLELPGVYDCCTSTRGGMLTAHLRVRNGVRQQSSDDTPGIRDALNAKQPWHSGSVVPDDIVIVKGETR